MNENCLLMVTMEPPASHEDEFNDWYDNEHFPQRRGLPGFTSGSRWVCLDGWPRWLALYDLESIEAMRSEAYKAVSGPNSTPWSQRLLPRTIGRSRIVARASSGNSGRPIAPCGVARLLVMRYSLEAPGAAMEPAYALRDALHDSLRGQPHLLETRVFFEQRDARIHVWGIASFGAPVFTQELAKVAAKVGGVGATVFNLYGPYQRG